MIEHEIKNIRFEVYKILKEANRPLLQKELLEKLVAMGFGRTCAWVELCVAPREWISLPDGDLAEPFIKKRILKTEGGKHGFDYILNETWINDSETKVKTLLSGRSSHIKHKPMD